MHKKIRDVIFLAATVFLVSGFFVSSPEAARAATNPEGTLVLANQTVFLISNWMRQPFRSEAVFYSYGYKFEDVNQALPGDLALPEGPVMVFRDGTLIKDPSNPLVYLVTEGQKSGFASESAFNSFGYNFSNVITADVETFADLPNGTDISGDAFAGALRHPAGTLVNDNGTIYEITPTGKKSFTSADDFYSQGYSFDKVVPASSADMSLPVEGIVVRREVVVRTDNPTPSITQPTPLAATPSSTPAFYEGTSKVTSVTCGDTYIFKVDNYSASQVWLTQFKNNSSTSTYDNIYPVPTTYTSICNKDEGVYTNYVYKSSNGQKGDLLGVAYLTVNSASVTFPDFAVEDMSIGPMLANATNAIEINKEALLKITVKNKGATAARPSLGLKYLKEVPVIAKQIAPEDTCSFAPDIKSGQTCIYALTVIYTKESAIDNFGIRFEIDQENRFVEADESNNWGELYFAVRSANVKPKLLSLNPSSGPVGSKFDITAQDVLLIGQSTKVIFGGVEAYFPFGSGGTLNAVVVPNLPAGVYPVVVQAGSNPANITNPLNFTITAAGGPTGWTFCASEGNQCSFSGTKEVRYGANGYYFYRILTGGTPCTNAVFGGDPIYGAGKQCDYRDVVASSAITVTSPSNGTVWTVGQPVTVSWKRNFIPENGEAKVGIYLRKGDGPNVPFGGGVPDSSYTIVLPSTFTPGNNYHILVSSHGTGSQLSDESDGTFSIVSANDGRPQPPFDVRAAEAIATDGSAKIYWYNVNGEKFYIYKNKNDGPFQFLGVTTDKFYKDTTGLTTGIKYGYYVTALNGYGESDPSNKVYVSAAAITIITPSPLPNAKVGQAYTASFYASGLTAPSPGLSFILWSGSSLPPGLTNVLNLDCNILSCVGSIGGTPTSAGTYTFTYMLTEGTRSTTKQFTLTVDPATTDQSLVLKVYRDNGSPSGNIAVGAQGAELFRIGMDATGQNAVIKQLNLSLAGEAVRHISNIQAFVDGKSVGTLSNLVNTSSWFFTAVINTHDLTIPIGGSKTISIRGDVSASVWSDLTSPCPSCNRSIWLTLNDVAFEKPLSNFSVSGLPVPGNTINIPYLSSGGGGSATSAITVTSPSNGNVWVIGQQVTVSWKRNFIPENGEAKVGIYLRKGDGPNVPFGGGVPDSSYTTTLPSTFTPGNDYHIVVGSHGTGSNLWDESDETFSIVDPTTRVYGASTNAQAVLSLEGPAAAKSGVEQMFYGATSGPDGVALTYRVDWGDGTSPQIEIIPSNYLFLFFHAWAKPGNYTVTISADDGMSPVTQGTHEIGIK